MPAEHNPSLPQHVAVIMDGNGRWAKQRGRSRSGGHRAGVTRVRELIEQCARQGIRYLTLYAFSQENWQRSPAEVSLLMKMFVHYTKLHLGTLKKNGIRLSFIGNRETLDSSLQKVLADAETDTQDNQTVHVFVALNYSARAEITNAARQLATLVQTGELAAQAIDENLLAKTLYTQEAPDPDLLIRTSGEQRLSNFLLWQLSYAELYFCDCYFPDFNEKELQNALNWYSNRQRRFGA